LQESRNDPDASCTFRNTDRARSSCKMNPLLETKILRCIKNFMQWLTQFGESSLDHQSFFAGPVSGAAKRLYYRQPLLGTLAVAPMIFCEAFVPSARRLFSSPCRFPIADAHYAMGFAMLSRVMGDTHHWDRAIHFLHVLQQTRALGYKHHCWGYPFDWVTRNGTLRAGTPMITTTPYVYEAFSLAYDLDGNPEWLDVMHSIAEHASKDIRDVDTSPDASSCSYTPDGLWGVVNASAYRAFLLFSASERFQDDEYLQAAERNLNFVLQSQKPDGSWPYAVDDVRDFVDHFHTCFVLKALAKIEAMTEDRKCLETIERGVSYYLRNLFDSQGLPKPFSKAPRLTVYRRELYDYAECVNLCTLLKDRCPRLNETLKTVLDDMLGRWVKDDGSFRSRELLLGWDEVPMHRWAQSQMFRSLVFLFYKEGGKGSR
jgi:hypothetical protein